MIFPKKTRPPGDAGLETTKKDGSFCQTPVSNFYCSGYQRKYEMYGKGSKKVKQNKTHAISIRN